MALKEWEKVGENEYVSKKERMMEILNTGRYSTGIAHAFVETEEDKVLGKYYMMSVEIGSNKKSIPAKNKAKAHKLLMSHLRSDFADPHIRFNPESHWYFMRG